MRLNYENLENESSMLKIRKTERIFIAFSLIYLMNLFNTQSRRFKCHNRTQNFTPKFSFEIINFWL